MGKLKAVAELFEGRHFDREVIILCVRWYLRFKLSLRDLVEMMAERGLSMGAYDDYALGAVLRTGVRETLETVCPGSRPVMAGRRDIRQDPRQVVLSVSRRRSGR